MKEELITFALKAFVVGAVAVGVIHFNHTHDMKLMVATHDYTNSYDHCMRMLARHYDNGGPAIKPYCVETVTGEMRTALSPEHQAIYDEIVSDMRR
jgi:hypothetical protein